MMSADALEIQTESHLLAVKAWGDPTNPPLIALHGWLDNAASFDFLAPYLLDNYYVMAVDLPGHGLSEHHHSDSHGYFFYSFCVDILRFINAHSFSEPVSLLGHSMGASIALLMAIAEPDRFNKLYLIDGLVPHPAEPKDSVEHFTQYVKGHLRSARSKPPIYSTFQQAVEVRAKGFLPVTLEASERLCLRGLKEVEGGWQWRTDPKLMLRTPVRLTLEACKQYLMAVKVPVEVILASNGVFKAFDFIKALPSLNNQINVHPLEGGHHLHMDDGVQACAEIILGH